MNRILLVDDEPHMRRLSELSLRKGGYELLFGADGEDAIVQAKAGHPDLIIMDVMMPRMDGLTALRHLKADTETKAIPVIMLTARGHVLTRQEATDSGAALFITKPFSPSLLLAEVQKILTSEPQQ